MYISRDRSRSQPNLILTNIKIMYPSRFFPLPAELVLKVAEHLQHQDRCSDLNAFTQICRQTYLTLNTLLYRMAVEHNRRNFYLGRAADQDNVPAFVRMLGLCSDFVAPGKSTVFTGASWHSCDGPGREFVGCFLSALSCGNWRR